jgi:histidinol-phosphate aminotransferase
LGIAIAHPALIHILSNAKAPYNVSTPTAHLALRALSTESLIMKTQKVSTLNTSRRYLIESLSTLSSLAPPIGSNNANFVMIPVLGNDGKKNNERAKKVYKLLAEKKGVVVRFRGNERGCEACLRITVGSDEENKAVVERLKEAFEEV